VQPQRERSGILFKNDRKTSANHPDYKGTATLDGEEFYISGWIKQGRNGKFLSLSFTAKNDQRTGEPRTPGDDEDVDAAFGR
jgi:hypothetical protein